MQVRHRLFCLILLSSFCLPACLVGSSTSVEQSGRFVSSETLARVQPGENEQFVLSLLGDPTDRVRSANGNEIWKWLYSAKTTKQGGVFLIASASKISSEQRATYVEFEGGKVIRTWRD